MAVTKKEQTPGEKKEEQKGVAERKQDASDALLSTLDLPGAETIKENLEDKPGDKKPVEPKPEDQKPEDKPEDRKPEGEGFTKEDKEELLATPDEELTEEGVKVKNQLKEESGDDELIPRSKVDKRFRELTSEVKELRNELAKKEKVEGEDPDLIKLRKMDISQLRGYKREVRKRQISETDEDKLEALLDLEMKIDDVIVGIPQRFQDKQKDAYVEAANEVASDSGIKDHKAAAPEIMKIANDIFARYPKMQKIEGGQAMALRLAAEHYKTLQGFSAGKTGVDKLKRFATNLKRKTTLDSNVLKKDKGKVVLGQVKEKAHAKGSTSLDKAEYIKQSPLFNVDNLIPDEFK